MISPRTHVSYRQAARLLGVAVGTVQHYAREGHYGTVVGDRRGSIPLADFMAFHGAYSRQQIETACDLGTYSREELAELFALNNQPAVTE